MTTEQDELDRLRRQVQALQDANAAGTREYQALYKAVRDVYYAGKWSAQFVHPSRALRLWEAVRDAAHFAEAD